VIDGFDDRGDGMQEGVQFTLIMPEPTVFTYSTATESECSINELWVLVFENATQTGALRHDTIISSIDDFYKGKARQLLPQLPYKADELNGKTIVFIANSGYTKASPPSNYKTMTYGEINSKFATTLLMKFFRDNDHLPMYGELKDWSSTNPNYSCEMIRSVAKIQMKFSDRLMDEQPATLSHPRYTLHNFPESGYIKPSDTTSWIPTSTATFTGSQFALLNKLHPTLGTTAFIHEYAASTRTVMGTEIDPTKFNKDRPFLLLRDGPDDKYENSTSFWRLDFYDVLAKEFIDIKRNCHYIFTIDKINSAGYPNMNAAEINPGSNIEYTIKVSDGASHVTSNGQYAVETNADTVYVVADTATVIARYCLPAEMPPFGAETLREVLLVNVNDVSQASYISWKTYPGLSTSNQKYVAKIDNYSSFSGARMLFKVGNIYHYVYIKK
jgi:hypothetical protein